MKNPKSDRASYRVVARQFHLLRLMIALPAVVVGVGAYWFAQSQLTREVETRMLWLAQHKAEEVTDWVGEFERDIKAFGRLSSLRHWVAEWGHDGGERSDSITSYLEVIRDVFGTRYSGLTVFGAGGRLWSGTPMESMGDTAAFRQAADGRSAVIFRLPVTPGELSDLRVYGPIIGRHDRVEAVLVARVNDKLLYETLADLYSPVSQHISLLNDEGIMIPCELIDGAVLHHPTQAPAAVAAMARQHARTVMRYTAADGREIIAAFQWIPSLGWGVLAERDADEAFGTFNRWRVLIGAAALFVVAVGVALNTMLANRMMRRLQKRERELQTTHEQLITADRLASVGMMAASIAHEVNNPLTTIKVLMHSVAERVPRSAQVGDDLDIVQSEIDKIKALILRFLQFARPKEPEFIVLDLNDILRRVVLLIRPQAEGRDIAVAESYHDELPSIRADGSQLGQVILNLLFNAIEAAPDGGRIRITTKTLPNGHVEAGIWNSGPGLSEELTERVFEPFFSTKATGTGLGLPIARMIIDKHRGSLTARGHGSEGTTFIIHLPSDRPDTDDASRISR